MSISFDKKLRVFEVAPPAHTWQRIEATLNEIEPELQINYQLYNAEAVPPPNAWNSISAVLETDAGASVIPLNKESRNRRVKLFYRYAAAAVLTGALVFGAITLTDKNPSGSDVAASGTEPSGAPLPTQPVEEETAASNNLPEENTSNPVIIPEDRSMIASAVVPPRTQYQGSTVPSRNESFAYQPANLHHELEAFSQAGLYSQITRPAGSGEYDPEQTTRINRYLIILTPDGQVIRMSPKFIDMVGCLYSGETPEDEWCREQVALWRQKMASAQLTPSPDNFMDILTLISSLQDQ